MRSPAFRHLQEQIGKDVRDTWRRAVSGTVLPGMPYAVTSPAYSRSIGDPTVHGSSVRVRMAMSLPQQAEPPRGGSLYPRHCDASAARYMYSPSPATAPHDFLRGAGSPSTL